MNSSSFTNRLRVDITMSNSGSRPVEWELINADQVERLRASVVRTRLTTKQEDCLRRLESATAWTPMSDVETARELAKLGLLDNWELNPRVANWFAMTVRGLLVKELLDHEQR